jgi:hypothetical protein
VYSLGTFRVTVRDNLLAARLRINWSMIIKDQLYADSSGSAEFKIVLEVDSSRLTLGGQFRIICMEKVLYIS